MDGKARRQEIIHLLKENTQPLSGSALAKQLGVSRQVIVQDIALLRAEGNDIVSTSSGYLLSEQFQASRVFKVHHDDASIGKELNMIVDLGGKVKDVFVSHKVYGLLRVDLNLNSRADIEKYLESIATGNSSPLLNLTSGYHYHTVLAENELILDAIQAKLEEYGFLAPLRDYEPVDFWKQTS